MLQNLMSKCLQCHYLIHVALFLMLKTSASNRGKGLWNLTTKRLEPDLFDDMFKAFLEYLATEDK